MSTKEKWHITQGRRGIIPKAITFRGKVYRFDRKYSTAALADAHAEYLRTSRVVARRPYRGKRPPFKEIRTLVKRIVWGKGIVWFAVYKREV